MNDDTNSANEALPPAEAEGAPARPKRTRTKVARAEATVQAVAEGGSEQAQKAPDGPSEVAREAAVAEGNDGPSTQAPGGERGDRPKRNRRRGRRGNKDGPADGAPASQGAGREPRPPRISRDERIEQIKAEATDVFGAVTSDAFDTLADPSEEDLQALADRVAAEEALVVDEPSADEAAAGSDAEVQAQPGLEAASSEAINHDDAAAPGKATPQGGHRARDDRRVLSPERDAPKLQKVLAQSGAGSRRDIEQWIAEGRISVNGQVAHTGQRVSFGDRVAVDGKPIRFRIAPLPARVIAYHKPVGEIVTHDDPEQRPTVFRKLPRLQHGKWQSVGRLDINTEGLLLFTNSGELANQLMHPRFGIDREYAVRVLGTLGNEARAKLLEGVDIDGQRAIFKTIDQGSGEGVNHWYRVTIAEGRNREVRRLFDAVGLTVSRLIRIRYGLVVLPKGLKRGVWVDLSEADVRSLSRLVGYDDGQGHGGRDTGRGSKRGGQGAANNNNSSRGRQGGQGGPGQQRGQGQPRDGQPNHYNQGPRPPLNAGGQGPRDGFQADRGSKRGRGRNGPARQQEQGPYNEARRGPREDGPIPNPLQQTFDKRAIREARAPRREIHEDGPIPNPLQQTYDQRALREANRQPRRDLGDDGPIPNPLQQTYDKRQLQGGDGLNFGRHSQRGGNQGQGGPGGQPDPMRTAVGYIGADAFRAKQGRGGRGGGGGGRGGPGGGQGGGRGPGGGGGGGGGRRSGR